MPDTSKFKIDYPWGRFLKDVFGFLGVSRWRYVLAIFLAITHELAWLYFPFGLGQVVTFLASYQSGQSLRPLYVIGLLLVLVSAWRAVGRRLANWIAFGVAAEVNNSAYFSGVSKLLRLGGDWHAQENSGNKVKRVQVGSSNIKEFFVLFVLKFVTVMVVVPGAIIVVAATDPVISLFLVAFSMMYFVLIRGVIKVGTRYGHAVKKDAEKLSGVTFETVNNIRTVQVGSLAPALTIRVSQQLESLLHLTKKRIAAFQLKGILPHAFANLFRISLLGYVVYAIIQGQYEVGMLVLVGGYFNNIWKATLDLSDIAKELLDIRYGVWRLKEVLDSEDYVVDQAGSKKFPKSWDTFSVNDVSFTYEDGQKTLTKVSFTVKQGQKVGLVGLSGAGKSTLFKLLTRERVPTKGQITIDGLPIQDVTFADYFKNIGVMLQETELFSFTLKENVTLATGRANLARFQQALEIAHVTDFLDKLPQGADTKIGEKGFKLSGGERQRVGIARAIYHQPQILFFDEATSHLDVESEKKIQDALQKLFENTTAVVIAHRLSTIKEMDEILVMDKGKIIERGSFNELIANKGRFFKLWQQQQL